MNRLMMKLMGFVVMNEAEGADAPQGAAAPVAAAVPAPGSTILTPPEATDTADSKPEDGKANEPGDPAKTEDDKPKDGKTDEPQGAPEAYADFTLPEGLDMDAGTLDAFKGLAKELNISQESAQKLVDLQSTLATKQMEQMQEAVAKQSQDWANQVYNDPELGGANFEKNAESAAKVIQAFGPQGLRQLLSDSGLGNNPLMFKFCHSISKAISEDKFVMPGTQADTPKEMSIIDAFR